MDEDSESIGFVETNIVTGAMEMKLDSRGNSFSNLTSHDNNPAIKKIAIEIHATESITPLISNPTGVVNPTSVEAFKKANVVSELKRRKISEKSFSGKALIGNDVSHNTE